MNESVQPHVYFEMVTEHSSIFLAYFNDCFVMLCNNSDQTLFPILLRMQGTLGDAKNLEILPRFLTIPSGPGERLSMKNHD